MNGSDPYSIAPEVARQAALDYLAIVRAEMVHELDHEIREALQVHHASLRDQWGRLLSNDPNDVLDGFRDGQGWNLRSILGHAQHLADLLECDAAAIEPHIFLGQWKGPTTRGIVLDVLRNMANYARREDAKARRQQAGRRS